jgi:hypothetical protein
LKPAKKINIDKAELPISSVFDACCTGVKGARRPKIKVMRNFKSTTRILIVAAMMMAGGLLPFAARMATVAGFSDALSTLSQGTGADHRILFVSATGVNAPTDTITLAFGAPGSFDLSRITPADVDFGYDATPPTNDCVGTFSDKDLAAAPAAGTWGVSVVGQTLTLSAPTGAVFAS